MKRKNYQKPVTKVELGIATQMLAASITGNLNGYGTANELIWGDDDEAEVIIFSNEINWNNE